MSIFGHSIKWERKSIMLFVLRKNKPLWESLLRNEPFAKCLYQLKRVFHVSDFQRKDNTLLGSKLTSYFKQI